jgi:hypothetical protein
VFGVGAAGALFGHRRVDWRAFDPQALSFSLGRVGNVLAASTDRWDGVHYLTLAQHGYTGRSQAVFYPLYPLLIHALAWVLRSDVIAGVLVSAAAFAVALELVARLTATELGERSASAVVLVLAFSPFSLFFTAIYTESLFLALSVGAFYLARQGRFGFAGAAATAAALTHVEGILLVAPLALMYWEQNRGAIQWSRQRAGEVACLISPLLAQLGLLLYLNGRGYGLLAQFSGQSTAGNGRQFAIPLVTIAKAVSASASGLADMFDGVITPASWLDGLGFQNLVGLGVVAVSLGALALAWKRLPRAYSLYAALVLIVLTSSPNAEEPLESIGRFALILFPLWMTAGGWLGDRRMLRYAIALSTVLLCFFAFSFGRWAFVA